MPKRAATWSYKIQRKRSPKSEVVCDECNGRGTPPRIKDSARGRKLYPAPCTKCQGKGRLVVSQEEALTRDAFVERRLSFMVKRRSAYDAL
jgi:DnaJ-class molecular chaperone